jgi:hypothetical protein
MDWTYHTPGNKRETRIKMSPLRASRSFQTLALRQACLQFTGVDLPIDIEQLAHPETWRRKSEKAAREFHCDSAFEASQSELFVKNSHGVGVPLTLAMAQRSFEINMMTDSRAREKRNALRISPTY